MPLLVCMFQDMGFYIINIKIICFIINNTLGIFFPDYFEKYWEFKFWSFKVQIISNLLSRTTS